MGSNQRSKPLRLLLHPQVWLALTLIGLAAVGILLFFEARAVANVAATVAFAFMVVGVVASVADALRGSLTGSSDRRNPPASD
jgi:hypothetical protein